MTRIWLAMVGALLLVGAAMSAHATLRAIVRHVDAPVGKAVVAEGLPNPAAAPAYTPQQTAAPAAGVTGTIDLPVLPMPVTAPGAGDVGVVPARPFSMASASAVDRGRALQCLTAAIYYEAASEPDAGQQAVAQVILNRVRHPVFPGTVCGVVYQGSERSGCQFSFACDGALARIPARTAFARASRAAAMALAGYVYAPVGLATHYHTYAVTPAWNRSLVMTDVVGAHFFHRWKGFWGTSAAFTQRYVGGEPVPGPHYAVEPVAPATPLVTIATAPVAPPRIDAQPAYAQSGTPRAEAPAAASGDHLPPASQILDRWKDSGKPL